ncbi:MAG: hypothetical protein ACRD3Q_14515, partial [Terriglobales bacterium]
VLMLVLLACFVLVAWPQAAAKNIIKTFDPPGPPGAYNPYQGTQALAINSDGAIAGFYSDSIFVYHGFLRAPDGTFTLFDAPDAGTQSVAGFVPTPLGVLGGQGTYATAMNDAGTITGFYVDIMNVMHGFLRTSDGAIAEFMIPGAGRSAGQGTAPLGINKNGAIAGIYVDSNGLNHVFLEDPTGGLIKFDAPGAGTGAGQGTFMSYASCLTPNGGITGFYVDANNVAHGFVRGYDGSVATFDAPNAGLAAGQGTYAWSINSSMQVTGMVIDSYGVMHGYVRYADGSFRKFDARGAGRHLGQGTVGNGINLHGIVVGNFINSWGENRGFWRAYGGAIKRFSVTKSGKGLGQGTVPMANNQYGVTSGSFFDDNFGIHGFFITF